jgi:hypothetical protein
MGRLGKERRIQRLLSCGREGRLLQLSRVGSLREGDCTGLNLSKSLPIARWIVAVIPSGSRRDDAALSVGRMSNRYAHHRGRVARGNRQNRRGEFLLPADGGALAEGPHRNTSFM